MPLNPADPLRLPLRRLRGYPEAEGAGAGGAGGLWPRDFRPGGDEPRLADVIFALKN